VPLSRDGQAITRYGVIGHSQTSARARRAGRPIILRRDFNGINSFIFVLKRGNYVGPTRAQRSFPLRDD
jgi:hypothetical protein